MNNNQNSNANDFQTNTLKDYINLIRLNIIPIFIISVTGLLVAIIYAVNAPNVYKSTTELKISKPTGNILESPLLPDDFGNDRFIANEIEVLKSYRLRSRVAGVLIDSFKTGYNKKDFAIILKSEIRDKNDSPQLLGEETITNILSSAVSIDQKRGLDIVEISAESTSPYEAALIANCYAESYRQLNLNYSRQQLTAIRDFLAKQRDEKLSQLATVEETLRNYQEQKGIVRLDEQASALITQASDFEAKMNAAKIDLTVSEKTLNQYKSELAKQDPEIKDYIEKFATEPYIKSLQTQIADLMTQRDRTLSTTSSSPRRDALIKDIDNKINDLKSKLDSQLSLYRAGILASSPEEIKELTRKVLEEEVKYQSILASFRKLNEIVKDYDSKLNQLPTSSIDLARLQRQESANEKLYLMIEEKYQEAVINEQSQPGNVLIIDAGLVPRSPSKPNRVLIVLIGIFLGMGLGVGFAFVRNHFDNTVKTPEDIQNRKINLLAWIPQIEGLDTANKDFEFIVAKKPDASASEAFRALRTRIKFSKVDKDALKTLLVTSSTSEEGKTTVSVNLAGSFAQANYRTVLIDADLRKPRVHNLFNVKRFPGITDYFFGQTSFEEIVNSSEINNLDYITAGTIPPNPSEILGSNQMEAFLEKLKSRYDYIILDSAPLIAVTDSEILSRMVDGTLLVVSANKTEVELMDKSVELLNHDKASFIGVLLNNFSYRSGYSSYYKYYYYYSRPTNGSAKKSKVKA